MSRGAAWLTIAVAMVLAVLAGPEPFGKLLYLAGQKRAALALVRDPGARGALLYDLGRYEEADAIFSEIGRGATYNRGNTLAATGDLRLAVAYFDAVLFADRHDEDARRNREIVSALVDPVVGEAMGHGRISTVLHEAGLDVRRFDPEAPDQPTLVSTETRRQPIEARTAAANEAWLSTLVDDPGEFLARRLWAERARRVETGTAAPEEASPW